MGGDSLLSKLETPLDRRVLPLPVDRPKRKPRTKNQKRMAAIDDGPQLNRT